MSERRVLSDFLKHQNSDFKVLNVEGASLTLSSCTVLKDGFSSQPADAEHAGNFSLVFLAPPDISLSQGLYELEHPELGVQQIFLVPIGIEANRIQLEAVFTSLPKASNASSDQQQSIPS